MAQVRIHRAPSSTLSQSDPRHADDPDPRPGDQTARLSSALPNHGASAQHESPLTPCKDNGPLRAMRNTSAHVSRALSNETSAFLLCPQTWSSNYKPDPTILE